MSKQKNNEKKNGATEQFRAVIKAMLDQRAEVDPLFAEVYAKESKSIEQCCDYIIGEVVRYVDSIPLATTLGLEDITCPKCGQTLTVRRSLRRTHKAEPKYYFEVLATMEGWQVVRHFMITRWGGMGKKLFMPACVVAISSTPNIVLVKHCVCDGYGLHKMLDRLCIGQRYR